MEAIHAITSTKSLHTKSRDNEPGVFQQILIAKLYVRHMSVRPLRKSTHSFICLVKHVNVGVAS